MNLWANRPSIYESDDWIMQVTIGSVVCTWQTYTWYKEQIHQVIRAFAVQEHPESATKLSLNVTKIYCKF